MAAAPILIVDDHPASLELVRYLMQSRGYETIEASGGDQAVALARRERPRLVICDLQLPDLSGLKVAGLLRADPTLQGVPLIAVTAFSYIDGVVLDEETVLAAGFDRLILKPIEPAQFMACIEAVLTGCTQHSCEDASATAPQSRS